MTKWLLLLSLLFTFACDDRTKASAARAPAALEYLFPLVARDVKQVRDGLPKGVETLSKLVDDEPGSSLEVLRINLEKARASSTELSIAKSTFFSFVSPEGVILRSEADPDLAAGNSLFKEIPNAKRIFEQPGLVEVFGSMHGLRGVEKGGDQQWLLGAQVKAKSGKVVGAFVTGWSLRKYADFLQDALRRHLVDTAEDKKRAAPLVYVFFARGEKAYGGAVTPDVDAEAVAKLGLPAKVQGEVYESTLTVEGQTFALVAKRAPDLDKDTVLVLLFAVV